MLANGTVAIYAVEATVHLRALTPDGVVNVPSKYLGDSLVAIDGGLYYLLINPFLFFSSPLSIYF